MQARLCVYVAPLMLSLCAIVSFPASSAAEQATVSPIPGGHAGLFRGRGNERIEAHQTSSIANGSGSGNLLATTDELDQRIAGACMATCRTRTCHSFLGVGQRTVAPFNGMRIHRGR